tara:strand:+ start:186 stop:302 length:117 start_codon:yes stop_codon:yes gene_type:complete
MCEVWKKKNLILEKPKYSIDQGIALTMPWYLKNLGEKG